jgi:hypothetical protein
LAVFFALFGEIFSEKIEWIVIDDGIAFFMKNKEKKGILRTDRHIDRERRYAGRKGYEGLYPQKGA